MLDVQLYGLNPGQHKITNVIFHLLNTFLLFSFLKKLSHELLPSAVTAFLFAVHPLHIQSIVWIAERKDLLCALFFFLSLHQYLYYLEKKSFYRYSTILLMYMIGLMSKPMIVTLPIILILLDFGPLSRFSILRTTPSIIPSIIASKNESLKMLFLEKVPFFILTIISSIITFYAQKIGRSVASFSELSLIDRISNALVSYILYLEKSIWPLNLSIIYPHPGTQPFWLTTICCIILILLSYIFLFRLSAFPLLRFGWLFFLVMLTPVIGIIQVGVQAMADRYMYLPIVGIFIIFSWGLLLFFKKYSVKPALLVSITSVFVILILSIFTWKQLQFWKDGVALFTRALSITENNFVAENNLGYELVQNFKFEEAQKHFRQALLINPKFEIAHLNLGRNLIEENKYDEGIAHYLTALEIRPDYADAHKNLGNTLLYLGRTHEAAYHYLQALHLNPQSAEIYNNLGIILISDHKFEEAIVMLEKALKLNNNFFEARANLQKAIMLRDSGSK